MVADVGSTPKVEARSAWVGPTQSNNLARDKGRDVALYLPYLK